MTGALADAAVGDHRLAAVHAFGGVQALQLIERPESAVIVASLAPGDVARSGDMPAALASFRQTWRSKNLAGEFLWTADIHQHRASLAAGCLRLRQKRAQRKIRRRHAIVRLWIFGSRSREFPCLGQPLLAPAIHNANILVPIKLELPQRPGGKPVVVVAIEHHGAVVGDSRFREQTLQRFLRQNVAPDVVAELRVPRPGDGAGDVALVIGVGIHIYFHDPHVPVFTVLRNPFRAYQQFRMSVVSHKSSPFV